MDINQFEDLAKYRILIGYLGEREQYGWWQSSFFTTGSNVFLSPIFSRTQTLAQCAGVTRAAQIIHDERIGVGNVYHLFRMPEDIEQGIHRALNLPRVETSTPSYTANKQAALDAIKKNITAKPASDVGPVRIGNTKQMRDPKTWQLVLAYYAHAFEQSVEIYPYFSDLS